MILKNELWLSNVYQARSARDARLRKFIAVKLPWPIGQSNYSEM